VVSIQPGEITPDTRPTQKSKVTQEIHLSPFDKNSEKTKRWLVK
jgi:hypothetical protein